MRFPSPDESSATMADVFNLAAKQKHILGVRSGKDLPAHLFKLQTGIFAVDYMMAGGIPLWRVLKPVGKQDSGKTTFAIQAMKTVAHTCWRCMEHVDRCRCEEGPHRKKSVYLDPEEKYDPWWADKIGVPRESYELPDVAYGADYLDLTAMLLKSDECACVIIDSIGALIRKEELDKLTGERTVCSMPQIMTQGIQKIVHTLQKQRVRLHPCFVIMINQIRVDLSIQYGSKESETCGNATKHMTITLRTGRLSLDDNEKTKYRHPVDDTASASKHQVLLIKNQLAGLSEKCRYLRVIRRIDDENGEPAWNIGDVVDHHVVLEYGERFGVIKIKKKSDGKTTDYYVAGGIKFRTRKNLFRAFRLFPSWYLWVQRQIIEEAVRVELDGEKAARPQVCEEVLENGKKLLVVEGRKKQRAKTGVQ